MTAIASGLRPFAGAALRAFGVCALWAVLTNCPVHAQSEEPPADLHARAIAHARAGRFEEALATLDRLRQRYPSRREYLYDYARVLGWAGRDADAARLIPQLDLSAAPIDVLETLAKSARNERQYSAADALYRRILTRDPAHKQARIGFAYTLAESGKREPALKQLDVLAQQLPQDTEVWFARGYVHEVTRSYVDALHEYQRVLDADPAHRDAERRRILVISKMGAPHLAYELMQQHADLFKPDERFSVEADRAAIQIRWGALTPLTPPERFDDTDRAITYLDMLHAKSWHQLDLTRAKDRRLAFDRMVALRDRVRMQEVVMLYEQVQKRKIEIPTFALLAAADAYVYIERPEEGVRLYQQVLQKEPKNYNARLSLFYAYTELDDFKNAFAVIDKLAEEEAVWGRHPQGKVSKDNPQKLEAEVAAAVGRAYADDLADAQRRLDALQAKAPANTDIAHELASVHRSRGWHRLALEEYERLLAIEPDMRFARIGRGLSLLDRRRYREAERDKLALQKELSEDKQVQRFGRYYDLYRRHELIVDSRIGHASSSRNGMPGQLGGDSLEVDSFLYSSPYHYNYRAFLHQHYANADFTEGTGTDHRLGAGVEYRDPDYQLSAEVGGGFEDNDSPGATVRGLWQANDYVNLGGIVDLNSAEVPLRGIHAGVEGDYFGVFAGYRWHESQGVHLGYGFLNFDDDNERHLLSGVFERRVLKFPHFKTTALVDVQGSTNGRNDVIYYSPKSDASASITLDNEWVNYRRYERRFAQRLELSVGRYWQEDFAPDFTWSVTYQHDWDFTEACRLYYGLVRSRRVFDGEPEFQTAVIVGINVRF